MKRVSNKGQFEIYKEFMDLQIRHASYDLERYLHRFIDWISKIINVPLVTVWNNNYHVNSLVLCASRPKRLDNEGFMAIPSDKSFTGLAIGRKKCTTNRSLLQERDGRKFYSPDLVRSLRINRMVSIPIYRPSNQDNVCVIVNLYISSEDLVTVSIDEPDLFRIIGSLGIALDSILYRIESGIHASVSSSAIKATGISSLFDRISGEILEQTNSNHASLYLLDKQSSVLVKERSTDDSMPYRIKYNDKETVDNNTKDMHDCLFETCINNGLPLVWLKSIIEGSGANAYKNDICQNIAVPILSSDNSVMGIIECHGPHVSVSELCSFSSFDLDALSTFAKSISPTVERFEKMRQSSILTDVVQKVSTHTSKALDLDNLLQKTIESILDTMQGEISSIYLLDEKSQKLVMRAGAGRNTGLIGKAEYEIGHGLTGKIAERRSLVAFKSPDEMDAFPGVERKYDSEIWVDSKERQPKNFLGLPIVIGDKLLGLWKLGNIKSTGRHPEDYFTDEDIQAGQMISNLLGFVIENFNFRDHIEQLYQHLVQTTIQIESAVDVEAAINSNILALAEANVENALISILDESSYKIVGHTAIGDLWSEESSISVECVEHTIWGCVLLHDKAKIVKTEHELDILSRQLGTKRLKVPQLILPLRFKNELIGILEIGFRSTSAIFDEENRIYQAFARHLSVAISRIRNVEKLAEVTDRVMSSSRFVVAETLSSMAVHSLHHKMLELIRNLSAELNDKEVKENKLLSSKIKSWKETLEERYTDLKGALDFVKMETTDFDLTDCHMQTQKTIEMWIHYLQKHKCKVQNDLRAEKHTVKISAQSFNELLSVLIVNSVQAHSKKITIRSFNQEDVKVARNYTLNRAFCIDFIDDGIGVQISNPEDIFTSTFTTKPNKYGTGLGLFIARHIAKAVGGNLMLKVSKETRKGTIFQLILPAKEI